MKQQRISKNNVLLLAIRIRLLISILPVEVILTGSFHFKRLIMAFKQEISFVVIPMELWFINPDNYRENLSS